MADEQLVGQEREGHRQQERSDRDVRDRADSWQQVARPYAGPGERGRSDERPQVVRVHREVVVLAGRLADDDEEAAQVSADGQQRGPQGSELRKVERRDHEEEHGQAHGRR